jgi:shikimate kinase
VDREQPFKEALLQKIVTLLKEREPTYAQADIVVERDGLEPEAIVTILEKKLKAKMEF